MAIICAVKLLSAGWHTLEQCFLKQSKDIQRNKLLASAAASSWRTMSSSVTHGRTSNPIRACNTSGAGTPTFCRAELTCCLPSGSSPQFSHTSSEGFRSQDLLSCLRYGYTHQASLVGCLFNFGRGWWICSEGVSLKPVQRIYPVQKREANQPLCWKELWSGQTSLSLCTWLEMILLTMLYRI